MRNNHISYPSCVSCGIKKSPYNYHPRCIPCANKKDIETLEKRFWRYVKKTPSCWLWTGGLQSGGYGTIGTIPVEHTEKAHRVSWVIHNGPIPTGLWVLHHCDVRRCVNPAHLFIGTHQDNMRDAKIKKRFPYGEQKWNAKLTNEQAQWIKNHYHHPSPRHSNAMKLARKFGVDRDVIDAIGKGIGWQHIR